MASNMLLVLMAVMAMAAALAVWLLLPKGSEHRNIGGVDLGICVGVAAWLGAFLITVAVTGGTYDAPRLIFFYIFATAAVFCTARVITHPQPLYSALYFVLAVLASAGMIVVLNATFLAIAIIIIYAGAILVTYVFVIMLARQGGAPQYDHVSREPLFGSVLGFAIAGMVMCMTSFDYRTFKELPLITPMTDAAALPPEAVDPPRALTNMEWIGLALVGRYSVALVAAGLLLLVAMVGSLAIARRPSEEEADRAEVA